MASPSTFVTVNAPVGVAVATDRLLYTQHSVANAGDPTIFSVSGGGVVDIFAPSFPSEAGIIEKYIDINPGLGPWATKAHYVYVTQGQRIYEITPDGLAVTPFATIPTAVATHTGVTFDREGTFNHDMIVTDRRLSLTSTSSLSRAQRWSRSGSGRMAARSGSPPRTGAWSSP
jgi:hypothetical protein